MSVWRREPKVRLRTWPSEDWYYAHAGYRFIKGTFHTPVRWAARMNVRGGGNVPTTGGVLLAANHLSWADPIVLGASIDRPAFYLAKESVFRNKYAAQFFLALGQIKVNREGGGNEGAVQTSLDLLEKGLVVGVFPEGTRSRPGQVKRGKSGIARIAALSGAPVVPVGIDCGDFWPKGRTLPRWGRPVYVSVGRPMRPDLKPEDATDKQKMRDATDEVMHEVRALYQECVRAREAGERWV